MIYDIIFMFSFNLYFHLMLLTKIQVLFLQYTILMLNNDRRVVPRRVDVTIYYVQVLFKLAKQIILVDHSPIHLSSMEGWLKSSYRLIR